MMQVKKSGDVIAEEMQNLEGVRVFWLWKDTDGAPRFAMRLFEVDAGKSTPFHTHPEEHEIYFLSGKAVIRNKQGEVVISGGDTAMVLPQEQHQIRNIGTEVLRFICCIPVLEKR